MAEVTPTPPADAMEAAREALSKSDYATAHDIERVVAIALDAFAEKAVATCEQRERQKETP